MSMRWLAAITLTLASIGASADGARAVLTELTGRPVVYELSNGEVRQTAMVVAGRTYTLPLEVETGANDTVTFELANSVIDVSANSMVRIVAPEQGATNVVQRVLQAAGSALFHVRRGSVERFQVETPFLVSVVKGTVFNVLVRDDGATVSLQEGRLEVTSVDARQTVDLLPGDVAFAGHDGVLRVLDVQLTDHGVRVRAAPTPLVADDEVASQVVAIANVDIEAARTTTAVPAADTIVKHIAEPTLGIVEPVGGVAPGIASNVVAPVVSTTAAVVTPVVDNVVAPVIGNVVTPVVDAVVAPVVAPVVETVVAPVVETVVAPVVETVVAPVVELVVPVVEPVVTPLVEAVVEPVIVPVIDGIADPVAAALDPVVPDVVTTTVDTVVTPVLDPIAPVLDPLLPDAGGDTAPSGGLLGGLLGRLH